MFCLGSISTLLILGHLAPDSVLPRHEYSLGVEAQRNGLHAEQSREMHFFPNFLLRELMAWYIALGVLGALAALSPWGLGTKAASFGSV